MTNPARYGERTDDGAARFRCAACGEPAGQVRAAPAGAPAGREPPLGVTTSDQDGLIIDQFIGTAWIAASRAVVEAVQASGVRRGDSGKTRPVHPVASTPWQFPCARHELPPTKRSRCLRLKSFGHNQSVNFLGDPEPGPEATTIRSIGRESATRDDLRCP